MVKRLGLGWHLAQAKPKGLGLLTATALPELELVRKHRGSEPEPSLLLRRRQMKAVLGLAMGSVRLR